MPLDPKTTAFIFPGQGSQKVGMGKDLAAGYPEAAAVFDQADQILGVQLSKLAWEGPEADLNDTVNTQPALLVHSVAALRVFEKLQPGFKPAFVAGHSLGELSAAFAAGAMDFESALRLVRRRGELMKEAGARSPGGMAAILGLDIPALDKICSEASTADEVVQIANDNCPGQVVISGHSAAVTRAMEAAKAAGAKRALPLAVSIAAHSPLMAAAQQGFNEAIAASQIADPAVELIGNVSAQALPNAAALRADLQAQLTSRVRWTETIKNLCDAGVTTFIELGSGSVLTGLLKRIDERATGFALSTPDDFAKNGVAPSA
jgi:[acyl-carrier-protein] S-malonyltransferase